MLAVMGLGAAAGAPVPPARSAEAIEAAALRADLALPDDSRPAGPRRHSPAFEHSRLRAFYAARGYAPLWTHAWQPTVAALASLQLLRHADAYGLRPADYDAETLARALPGRPSGVAPSDSSAPPDRWADWELGLSSALLALIDDLHEGRIDPAAAGFELSRDSPAYTPFDAGAVLKRLAGGADPHATVAAIEPRYLHYRLLEQTLPRYQALVQVAGLTDLPPLPARKIGPGQPYAGAAQLRRLLIALRYLAPGDVAPQARLDVSLVAALRRFQSVHGLAADGVLGAQTMSALTVPMAERVRQIELTLERWRWLPPMRYPTIIVNIPEYRLFAFASDTDSEQGMLRMDVIVGRDYPRTRTPVFMADMRTVVFRPYWDVPRSIAVREILPALATDPQYLLKQHLELVRGPTDASPVVPATADNLQQLAMGSGNVRLRQQPGPDNALGLIKFLFPNAHDVYLHATPAMQLFEHSQRMFSHGCIRVSDPRALAQYVLRNAAGHWDAAAILAAMHGTQTERIPLVRPVHVLILYGTAIADQGGQLHFLPDVYGQDRRLERLLGLAPVALR